MAKEQVNPDRACPACSKLREEVAELRTKLEALEAAVLLGPHAPRCGCGKYATRVATVTHPMAGPGIPQPLCDACEPKLIGGVGTTTYEMPPNDRLGQIRRVNAAMGAQC